MLKAVLTFVPLRMACLLLVAAMGLPAARAHERRIGTWLVVGPFANVNDAGFATDYLNTEAALTPEVGTLSGGKPWAVMDDRLYCRNQDDYIDLSTWFLPGRAGAPAGGNEQVLAYAHVYIWSPVSQSLKLLFGASDGAKVWLNGQSVATLPMADRQPIRDENAYAITLLHGWNRLLVKSANRYRIWGFYAKIAQADGSPVEGLEYSVDRPQGTLGITTTQLPAGYTGWPYRWLTIDGVTPNHSVPSASPIRLLGKGGTPPYQWSIADGALPPGLTFNGAEGEFAGECHEHPGSYAFTVRLTDAAQATAEVELSLTILDRPTLWMEQEKIGGLIHGTADDPDYIHGPPEEQATVMQHQGYAYGAQTTGWIGSLATGAFAYSRHPDFMTAFAAHGMRFGSYFNFQDQQKDNFPTADYGNWARYLDFHHRYFQEWLSEAHPAVLWLDAAQMTAPVVNLDYTDSRNKGWDFDALYSMAKTVSPQTLITANCGGNIGLDWRLGDCDVFSTEGMNDGHDPYWERFPEGQSGHNPKRIPNESWRYPFKSATWGEYADWREWTRVLLSIVCEGHICNLDHSYFKNNGTYQLHLELGDWITPRLATLKGTRPGPYLGQSWGYSVQREKTIYLHVMSNPRGKVGLNGATSITLDPFPYQVEQVRLVPGGQAVPHTLADGVLTLDMQGLPLDEIDTIVAIQTAQPVAGKLAFQAGNAPRLDYDGVEDVGLVDNDGTDRAQAARLDVGNNAQDWAGKATRRFLLRFDVHELAERASEIASAKLILKVANDGPGASQTAVLQDRVSDAGGANGSAVMDVGYLLSEHSGPLQAADANHQIGATGLSYNRALLRWDLSSLQGRGTVTGARVKLTMKPIKAEGPGATLPGSFSFRLFKVSKANAGWVDAEVHRGQPRNGASWAGSPMLASAGVDYDPTPVATVTFTGGENHNDKTVLTFELTSPEFLTEWAAHPEKNAGFLLVAPELEALAAAGQYFYGDLYPDDCTEAPARYPDATAADRPVLEVDLRNDDAALPSRAGALQFDAPTWANARWDEASTWDWIDGAQGTTLWPDQARRPANQPPAPQAGAGVSLCAPVEIAAGLPDGTPVEFPLSTAGLEVLRRWTQPSFNEGLVAIMPTGNVTFHGAEATPMADRPCLVVTFRATTAARYWSLW